MSYDPRALRLSAKHRQKNIQAFKDIIKKEQDLIDHFKYVISQIDPDHPDVKKLRSTIKKKKENIQIFRVAINKERKSIKEELTIAGQIAKLTSN